MNTSGTVAGEEETVVLNSVEITERETNFNDGWKFYLGNVSTAYTTTYDDSSWEDVTLPHDYSITQDFTTSGEAESGFLPGGTGWYRKTFTLSEELAGSSIVISFDGVYSDAYVYVNGEYIGENHYGYTSFAFDITDYLVCDGTTENVIAVKVVNNIPSSRWYSGSGIYRDVTLTVTDEVHVACNGTYVTTPDLEDSDGSDGTASVEIELDNDGDDDVTVTVKNTIYTDEGEAASETVVSTATISAGSSATVTAEPSVSNPDLWSVDDPDLYYVLTEIYVDDTLVDSYQTEFGYRWYSFDEDSGFYLNGEALKLNGVCLHNDQGAAGSAAYYDAIYRQLSTLKDMGVNAIRTSHNPADEDFIDICNELGLLVIEEAFDGWSQSKNGNTYDFSQYFSTTLSDDNQIIGGDSSMTWAEYAIKSMVKRDRNDPSVILWSLGNEITEGVTGSTSDYPEIAQDLIDWIEELDDTRQTTIGDNGRTTSSSSVLYQVDQVIVNNGGIVGINYGSSSQLSTMKNALGAIYSSETSSAVNSRGIYSGQTSNAASDDDYHITSYDTSAVSWGITAHESLWNTLTTDYVAGEFVWTGWDYIGEPTPWNGTSTGSVSGSGAVPNSSYFGIVDTAGFEKDTYYLYRSQWNQSSTTLHLVTAWDENNIYYTSSGTNGPGSNSGSNKQTPVVIYSNAAKVELYLNDDLIGTATRTTNTTDAGHTYYTYTTSSNNSSVCTAVTGSDSTSLYATFNVTYTSGTIRAVAYDEEGNVIEDTCGTASVSTPGSVSQMEVTASTEEVDADGQSLIYIEVELQDSEGNLVTTAENEITFTVSGAGTILGVDNGDQSTTEKYQQSSVIDSETQAHIDAYAGKALVIIRSTQEAGTIEVSISADGMSTQTVTVTSDSVTETAGDDDLVSYTMVRNYSIKAGTVPELLTSATVTLGSGETIEGTVEWEEISSDIYSTAGDYTVTGTLSVEGYDPITVTAVLHVIDNIIVLRNVSTVTAEGVLPTLPTTVNGVLADGTVSGEFVVEWEEITADQFDEAGEIVTVSGTATIIGTETLDVTCTVRVAEAVNTESTNVATSAEVTQDIEESYQSDTLSSVNNGVTTFKDDTNERWTNWNNRYNSDTAALTFTWSTAQLLESVNIYYYNDGCAVLPENVKFEYSLNGTDYVEIGYTAELIQTATLGWEYTYTFDEVINPISVRITFTQKGGTTGGYCVGVIEVEMMTYAGSVESNGSADLSMICVDGAEISGFDADILNYEVTGNAVTSAATEDNAGITILPEYNGVVRILTISEDGNETKTYAVELISETEEITITFNANGGEGSMDAQTAESGKETTLNTNTFTREGYTFSGWNTSADGTGTAYSDGAAVCLSEDTTLYAQWTHNDGWFTTESGLTYYADGELQKTGWTEISDKIYYLDPETGYAAADGIYWLPFPEDEEWGYGPDEWDEENNDEYDKENSYFIFGSDGALQTNKNGFYTVTSETTITGGEFAKVTDTLTVWAVNGELPWHPGLVESEGSYYYFTTGYYENGISYVSGKDYYVSKPNDLAWPESWGEGTFTVGTYTFDSDGKLQLYDGFTDIGDNTYYYVKGVKTYAGLIQIDGYYYYVNSSCKVIKGQSYYVSKTNDLLPAGTYTFDSDGKMVIETEEDDEGDVLNGIVKESDDTWYYYVNGVKTYAGLIEIGSDYYYVNSSFKVIHGQNYYISKTNGLKDAGTYYFDDEGKMESNTDDDGELLNGIVKESDDTWYYYVNGVKTYAGLIEIGSDYYYVNSSFKVIHGQNYYISKTNGLVSAGTYTFDNEGKMESNTDEEGDLLDGIVKKDDDTWYYYVSGVKTYAGLIEIDGYYYYVNSSFKVIHGQSYYISKTNGLKDAGTYYFDDDGKMSE